MYIAPVPPDYHLVVASDGTVSGSGPGLAPEWVGQSQVGDAEIAHALRMRLPQAAADLVDVAAAVHIADRLCRRDGRTIEKWSRHIAIEIPVRDPERWNHPTLYTALHDLLAYLTEDEWSLTFVQRVAQPRVAEMSEPLFSEDVPPTVVALFSGGLDSLAGASRELIERRDGHVVLLSIDANDRLGKVQRDLVAGLRRKTTREIIHVSTPLGYRRRGRPYNDDERTQRSRGFAFLALGAVVAHVAGVNRLSIYENGIGAINLPYSAAQFGAQQTRAVAPETLVRMGAIVRLALDGPFAFDLPFLFETKATLCGSLTVLGVAHLVSTAVSCDGFPLRKAVCQCGTCTSCLLRRQSIHAAGLAVFDGGYLRDVLDPPDDMTPARWHPLQLMRGQARVIHHAVNQADPWRALCHAFPQLIATEAAAGDLGFPRAQVAGQLVALYRCYCDEWASFPAVPLVRAAQVAA